ncbi:MAG: hypothetical protein HF973_14290 [Chloroflexi bacterium]|nr:hypothetical protein [Chloroflexota bacterium]
MTSPAVVTITKMIDTLPEYAQDQAVEHLRDFIADMQDEIQWDDLFQKTENQLVAAARQAKQEIAAGQAKPMDYDQL